MNLWGEVLEDALRGWKWGPVAQELLQSGEVSPTSAAELLEKVEETAAKLANNGVAKGVFVALFLENSVDFLAVLLALFRLEAVAVIGKVEYRSVELTELFANADPAVVIAESQCIEQLAPFLAGRMVVQRDGDGLSLLQQPQGALRTEQIDGSLASINYTYRGLGIPLGAMITPQQYLHGARVLQEGLQAEPGEPMLFAIPMTHIFTLVGCLLVPLLYGLPLVIARTVHPRRTSEAISRLGVGHITAVPELYRLLLRTRDPSLPLPSLRTFVSGGSYLGEEDYAALTDAFEVEVLHGYGLTEFTPVSRNSRGESRPGTIGPLCDGVDVQLAGKGSPGEILIRSESMRGEYYRRAEVTRTAWQDGWFRTGDIGHFSEGHLVFDRELKRTCKVNGLLVDLLEVENTLLEMPGVHAARVAAPGGRLTATVETNGDQEERELSRRTRAFLKDRLAAYKLPESVKPMT